jgi:ribonuclease Y
MDPLIITIIVALVCLVAGILLGKIVFAKNTQKQLQDAESQAQSIVREPN